MGSMEQTYSRLASVITDGVRGGKEQTMPWMPCKDCERCLYKDRSANEYPCILCCKGFEKYDMWKSARMGGAEDEAD